MQIRFDASSCMCARVRVYAVFIIKVDSREFLFTLLQAKVTVAAMEMSVKGIAP